MKIAVMGAGGMGGYLGGRLHQAGRDVAFVARGKHLRAIQRSGLRVHSPDGDFAIEPVAATDDPATIGPVDLILFCVRTYDVRQAAASLQPMLQPHTAILPIQNGIGHIDMISEVLGVEHLLGGVSLLSAQVSAPGRIRHNMGPDLLEFGEIKGGHLDRCQKIEEILTVHGFRASASANIMERMWWKFAAYAGVGVFCVVRGDRGVLWDTPETKALYRQAIAEAVAVAQAKGIPLSSEVPDEHIAILDDAPPHWKPSMLVALERGHRLELESLQGHLRTIGREVGVPTPVNDTIYACLKPHLEGTP